MNKKGFIFLLIIIILIIGIIYVTKSKNTELTNTESSMKQATKTIPEQTTNTTDQITSPPPGPTTYIITYTDSGFSPTALNIEIGDTVTFQNNSTRAFWPASDEHPAHTIYPEFDPKKTIAAGESWSFTFTKTGSWDYHDHRSAKLVGTITVK